MIPVLSLVKRPSLLSVALLCLLSGCQQKPYAPAARPAVIRTNRRPVVADTSPAARVQSLPLYRQAQAACSLQHYREAAGLLARLSTDARLSVQERDFCREQQTLCLRDAGLPAPQHSAASSAPSAIPPASSRTFMPEQADCGPRALLLLCQYQGLSTSLPQLRQWAGTTSDGTSMAGLAVAAKAAGLKAQGVQVSREALPEQEMPAIAYVNSNHFVAVLSMQGSGDSGTARIHDPNSVAEETIPQERLLRLCSGYLLLLHR